jgi:hypothetical protein
VKKVAIAWWAFEICITFNKFNVTRKCLEVRVYDDTLFTGNLGILNLST